MTAAHVPPPEPKQPAALALPEPHLFRFSLRRLFLLVAGLCAVLAGIATTDGVWPFAIGFVAMLVTAHVAATTIGCRLRDSSEEVQVWRAVRTGQPDDPVATPQPVPWAHLSLPAQTPLAEARPAPWWALLSMIAVGAAGATLGGLGVHAIAGADTAWPGIALGAASCAVMAAWLGWVGGCFWSTAREAWKQAEQVDAMRR